MAASSLSNAARLLGDGARRAMVPASALRPLVLRPRYDIKGGRNRPRFLGEAAIIEHHLRRVLPLEISYDAKEDVVVLCRTPRACLVKYATGTVGLLHSDLTKYWVGEALQEVYADVLANKRPGMDAAAAAGDEAEFGTDMDAALQTFCKFGSALLYELGTCCLRDENGVFPVVDGVFYGAYSTLVSLVQATGYTLWTVPKIAFECGAFKVDRLDTRISAVEYILPDEAKFRAVHPGASNEEMVKATQVKTTVEVDRSLLGKGKLVLFMPPESAWNKFQVFADMCNLNYDMKGLELEAVPSFRTHQLKFGASYAVREIDRSRFHDAFNP